MPYMDPMGMNVHHKTSHTKHGLCFFIAIISGAFVMFQGPQQKGGHKVTPPTKKLCNDGF